MFQSLNITKQPEQDYWIGISTVQSYDPAPLQLPYANLFICQSGNAKMSINFKQYSMQKGDVLFLSDDAIAIMDDYSQDFSLFYCLMARSFASEVAYVLPSALFSYLHHHPHFIANENHAAFIQNWITQSIFSHKNGDIYARTLLCNHLQNFFLVMATQVDLKNTQSTKYSRQEVICWRFWALIGEHCQKERSVAFYANRLSITPYYLSQLAQSHFNDAPKTLIDRQVILEIKRLLTQTQRSIEAIADAMNFNDPSYLCRYFKRHTGVSLSQYRKTG